MAIGAGSVVNAASRAEKITIFMLNNANYGTTGGQMAPTTLIGQKTVTTPEGRDAAQTGFPVHAAETLATMKGVAYSARGAMTSPADFQRTKKYFKKALQKQIDNVGLSFVETLSTCPSNWHLSPIDSLDWVENTLMREFPLGEFKDVDSIE